MNEIVKYSNEMNKIRFKNFTQRDSNFFMAICSKLKENKDSLVELTFDEIRRLSDYKENARDRFVADLSSMNNKLHEIDGNFETEEEIVVFNLFSTFRILKTKDIVKIRVNPDFADYLYDWVKGFTRFDLCEYTSLESTYTKNLFRILKQWRTQGKTRIYTIEEIQNILDIPEYAQAETKYLKKRIIDKAVKELNEKGYFKNLECHDEKAKKRGAPVIGYYFTFDKEKPIKELTEEKAIEHKENGTYQKFEKVAKTKSKPPKGWDIESHDYDFDEIERLERERLDKLYDC